MVHLPPLSFSAPFWRDFAFPINVRSLNVLKEVVFLKFAFFCILHNSFIILSAIEFAMWNSLEFQLPPQLIERNFFFCFSFDLESILKAFSMEKQFLKCFFFGNIKDLRALISF